MSMKEQTWKAAVSAAAIAAGAIIPFAANADGIRWEHAKNIVGDADVRTDGVLRYAYANKAAIVNGVSFAAGVNKNGFPDGVATMADVGLNVASQYIDSNNYATTVPAGASEGYLQLIRAGVYSTSAVGGTVTNTVTLKNLIQGHAYIVQLWTNDSRANPGNVRYIKVDGTEILRLRTSNGFGQHITGAFTATGDSQSFTIVGCIDTSNASGVSQFASLQLRDVTPGLIAWEDVKNITDDDDVRLDGECVFAAGWTAATAIVNNVVFVPLAPTNSTTIYRDVRMTTEFMTYRNVNEFNKGIAQTLSDDYHRLMGGATYPSANGTATVTLEGLAPGGRYLVQLWVNDTRSTVGPYRWQEIDGGKRMAFAVASGTYGQHITGVFTAEGLSKSLKITSLYTPTSKVTKGNPQINAIQLRRLDSGAATHWRVSSITKRDDDVRLDGELLYAYNFTSDTTDAEVNGVTFKGWKRPSASASTDDFDIAFPSGGNSNGSAFGITDGDMSAGYKLMIQSATYPSGGTSDATPSTLTLKRLTPGHRYLVQLWAHDGRSAATTGDRYMTLDGVASVEFKNEGLFNPARGDVATGIFTATAATKTISMLSGHHSSIANRSVQINGMQVRDLGAVLDSAHNVWAGGASGAWGEDATNWNDLAGEPREGTLWDAANGAGNTALFTAATSTALPSQDLTVGGIVADGALTVGAENDGKGVAAGFVEAQSCAFKSAWTADTLAKYDLGSFTLEGASPNLSSVVAGAGVLTLSCADALKTGADVVVATNATLTLAGGAAPVLCRLAGEGTLAFSGTVTLTNESVQAFTGTLDGDVVVRKAGHGDWTLGGMHTGTLALDAQAGTTILATDGVAVSIADGATVSLGGATRSLGTVSGEGTITNGTVSTVLAIADGSDITLGAVTLSAGVTLNGASSVTFAGDKDLAGLSVHVADPAAASASRKAVVAVEGEMTGEPAFTFGAGGYKAKLAEGGSGYIVRRSGLMLIVK